MQILRFESGATDKKKLEKHQYRQLVGFLIAVILLTVGNVVELLYVYVFYPLSKLVLSAGFALAVLFVNLFDSPLKPPKELGNAKSDEEFFEEAKEALEQIDAYYGRIKEYFQSFDTEPKEMDLVPVAIGFVIVAAIVILAVMIGDNSKKKKQAAIEDEREEYYEEVPAEQVIKKRSVHPEIVIRYYYREFMKKSEAKKHKLKASDTTEQIFGKYQIWNDVTPEQTKEAEEVTALYQKTRYSKAKLTHADAGRMKALVKRL